MRRFLVTLLAYLVPTFILGYVWHLVLFAETYATLGIYRPDVIIPFGFLSMVLQGGIFAALYPRLVDRPESLGGGMRFALGSALLSWTFTTLAVAAKHPMSSVSAFVMIETAFTVVQFVLVGPLFALSARVAAPSTVAAAPRAA
jgi:hypothetical protein